MTEPLDETYFTWLYGQVSSVEETNPSKTYWDLLRALYKKEFIWVVPNDDNRAEDGRDLRIEFFDNMNIHVGGKDWAMFGCSMLEMLIGVSRRLAFEAEGRPQTWFWQLIRNLGLNRCTDNKPLPKKRVDDCLDQVIWRTYSPDGTGGLFPLKDPQKDQRQVEIWYQLSAYLLERDY